MPAGEHSDEQNWLTPRGARGLVALLLGIKLAVTLWNAVAFDGQPYDAGKHARRAISGGLELDDASYDPPLYYLPSIPYVAMQSEEWKRTVREQSRGRENIARRPGEPETPAEQLLRVLRLSNLVHITAFYLLWIYGVLPRVIGDWRARTLAALLLLALPGYQKLAVMPHADNFHVAMAALCTFAWLRLSPGSADFSASVRLAVVAGLSGLTRPFAAATVATFAAANALYLWLRGGKSGLALKRVVFATLLTAAVASSWFAYRGLASGQWRETYPKGYVARFDRSGFDYVSYLTTFHFLELVKQPSRRIDALDPEHFDRDAYVAGNRYANSFFTTLYSETWGDHWLYFSGAQGSERKLLAKRMILLLALPLLPLLTLRFVSAVASVAGAIRRRGLEAALDAPAVLALHFAAGAALFLWWQLGSGLFPGKQSSIKFIYSAYLYAPAVTLCFVTPLRRHDAWLAYLLVLFIAAFPMSLWVPKSW